jgi:2-methylcitrate dehydratase PrpD
LQATTQLARLVYETGYDDIPQAIIERAKLAIFDSIGIALRGSLSAEALLIRKLLPSVAASGKATVVADGRRCQPQWAAFANAVMVNSLELDDTSDSTYCHPAATVVPAVLAVAEEVDVGGKDLLAALVLGYEVTLRVAAAARSHRAQGFAITGTTGTFGAAAATGKVLGLNEEQLVSALGLAGTLAPLSLLEFLSDGSMSKTIYAGGAAHNGVLATLLAAQGVTGPVGILDGKFGFLAVASALENDPSMLVRGLGEKFLISSVSMKPYACCRHFHGAIDCLLELREEKGIDWYEDIARITIHSNHLAIKGHGDKHPATVVGAQQSFPYVVAVALLEGHVNIDDFAEEKIQDPRRYALADRVELLIDEEMVANLPQKVSCSVRIDLKNGESFQCYSDMPKGTPEKPLSVKELEDKFIHLTTPLINKERQLELKNTILSLEKASARELGQLLMVPK